MALSDRRVASLHEQGDPLLHTSITGPLLLDLLEWLAAEPRRYADTMDAWRTSCPRLPIWEEAVERGFVRRERGGRAATVSVTDSGRDFLRRHRP
jgi:hypothetical protein